jgi:O-antigen/teichoic acid export membrane protein
VSIIRHRLLRNGSWNLVDQALSALSNTVLTVMVARSVSAEDFGAFAIAFVVFGIFIAVTKSVVGQPLQMRFSGADSAELKAAIGRALGAALLIGLLAACAIAAVSPLTHQGVQRALVALAVVLPALLVQDSCRMALFALARPRGAALIDAFWTAIMIALLMLLVALGRDDVRWLTIAWGIGAAVSATVGLALIHVRPAPRMATSWLREQWDLSRYLFAGYFLGLGAVHLGILLVGIIATSDAVGALRAAQVLLGPLGILGAAAFQFAMPEIARRREIDGRTLSLWGLGVSGALGSVTVAYVVALLLVPDHWGTALFGATWAGAAAVLAAMGISSLFSSLASGPACVLYGISQARSTFRIYLAKGPIILTAVVLGTWTTGAVGAAWALALTEAAVLPAWIITMERAVRSRDRSRRGAVEEPPRGEAHQSRRTDERAGI